MAPREDPSLPSPASPFHPGSPLLPDVGKLSSSSCRSSTRAWGRRCGCPWASHSHGERWVPFPAPHSTPALRTSPGSRLCKPASGARLAWSPTFEDHVA